MTENSLILIVAVSALLFGAVEPWSMAVTGTLAALAFILFIVRTKEIDIRGGKPVIAAMAGLFLFGLFQLIPLPVSVIGLVHPALTDLVTLSTTSTPAFHPVSVYSFATETELARILVCMMVFSIAAFGIKDEEGLLHVLKTLSVFGFILALFSIIQYATANGKIYWFRELTQGGQPFGPFVNRNHFAGFIGMIIPLSLGMAFSSEKTEKKVIFAFLSVVMAISLFFSLSRGGVVSFFGGIAAFAFFVYSRRFHFWKGVFPLFLFLVALAAYLLYLGIDPLIERFASTEITGEQRLLVWEKTLSAVQDFPLFGSGLGTYQHIFKAYQPDGVYAFFDHAHNDYLEFLIETGIVGSLIGLAILFFILKGGRIYRRTGEVYLSAGLLASITSMAIHSLFDFNLHIFSNALLFSLVAGMFFLWKKMGQREGKSDGIH